MKPSQQSFTIDDLKQAARKTMESYKKDLLDYIKNNQPNNFKISKRDYSERLYGLSHFGIFFIHDKELECEFREYVYSLGKEIDEICWPEN